MPPELHQFLVGYIDSIAQLEALLLLREGQDVAWRAPDLAKRLYISERDAAEVLSYLQAHGLADESASGYRYAPATEELSRMAMLLSEHYRGHLIAITNLVHTKPRQVRQFANAFKLKKE